MRSVLALRNLVHDRVGLALVAGGVAFAIVLVAVQLGLFLGFKAMTAGVIDHAGAQLWIVPRGTTSFDDPPSSLSVQPSVVAAAAGVKRARPIVVGFAQWRGASGGGGSVIVVGTTAASDAFLPWSMDGDAGDALARPDGVIVDRSYRSDLGDFREGELAHIEEQRARVAGTTSGIRSFTSSPYVFTRVDRARGFLGLGAEASTYLLVDLDEGASAAGVKAALSQRLKSVDVLTTDEFRDLNADHWLFSTGAGAALLGGAVLGAIVGAAIVAQTVYGAAKDHLGQFATLRAIGARRRYVVHVVLLQALASGLLGYALAIAAGLGISAATRATAMPVLMSAPLAGFLLLLTLVICGVAAVAAVVKVTRVDPMSVLSR